MRNWCAGCWNPRTSWRLFINLAKVSATLDGMRAPSFRLEQVRRAVFREGLVSYEDMAILPENLRRTLGESAPILSLFLQKLETSSDGRCRKALLRLADGKLIESVLLKPSERRYTACVSVQVGCAVSCSFCATGLMGFARNLSGEEITDQILFWRQFLARERITERLSNVVYMGMGEPLATYESLAASLKALMDPRLFGLGARHISVSTSGLAPQMERFAEDFPQVNLALSLHAANDELRTKLVPVNKAYPLARLAQALAQILARTSRKIFLEYVLLRGTNDAPRHAQELIEFIRSIGFNRLLHVNLIIFNATDTPHEATEGIAARRFQSRLKEAGVLSTVRQNLGRDISGACGQLVTQQALPA